MRNKTVFEDTSLPIHQRYSNLIDSLKTVSPVLKTDLWNELNTEWPIHADIYVEFDNEMVKKAKSRGLKTILGDICDLPLESVSVSTIIDLSTIDHVADPYPALKEYNRVLKNNKLSTCYLVTWLGDRSPEKMSYWDGYQYYFDEVAFITAILKTGFRIKDSKTFDGWGDEFSYLKFYHLKKQNACLLNKIIIISKFRVKVLMSKIRDNYWNLRKYLRRPIHRFNLLSLSNCYWNNVVKQDIKYSKNLLHFKAIDTDPFVILPYINFKNRQISICMNIIPPKKTQIQIFYLENGEKHYCEEMSVRKTIQPHKNKVCLPIPSKNITGGIRIDFGFAIGDYIIKKIEVKESLKDKT